MVWSSVEVVCDFAVFGVELWKKCKCECNGRIKCFFLLLVDRLLWLCLLIQLPMELRSIIL